MRQLKSTDLFAALRVVKEIGVKDEMKQFAQAVAEGYLPDTLHDVEGITAEIDLEKQGDLKVLVTEESVCIQTSGRIKFVSDNVTVLDKKLAKAMEAGKTHPAFVLYK